MCTDNRQSNSEDIDDNLKIKEDAIRIMEQQVNDLSKNIDIENTKSSWILGFIGVIFALFFDIINDLRLCESITIFVLLAISAALSLWNITSKDVPLHRKMDPIFQDDFNSSWKDHLSSSYRILKHNYDAAEEFLARKTNITKASFICITLTFVFLTIFVLL